jgi:hypothetical protein
MKKAMKIIAMVLFVVGMTALTSCTKSKEKLILGKWEIESISITVGGMTMHMTPAQLAQMYGIPVEGELDAAILEFKNDGYVYYRDEKVEYTIVDDQLSMMLFEDDPFVGTITELTDKEMIVEANDYNEESGVTSVFAVYFKRV